MDWEMTLRNEREKGREEGLKEGRMEERIKTEERSRLHCWKRETIDQRYARVNAMNDKKSVIHHK